MVTVINCRTKLRGHQAQAVGIACGAVASTVLVLGMGSGSAFGQTAAGDGHALDANHATGASRQNTARQRFSLNDLNNAIVTGNVAGGKGFRGDLGYSAAGDFRGATGSNDLFSLSSNSYLPGLIYQRTGFLQVPSSRTALNARYQWSLQPSNLLDRAGAGSSIYSNPYAHWGGGGGSGGLGVIADPAGSLGMVQQPSRLRNSLINKDLGQGGVSLTPQWRLALGHSEFTLEREFELPSAARSRTAREFFDIPTNPLAGFKPDSTGELRDRSVWDDLDLFGMSRERGLNKSNINENVRGLPNTGLERGTPSEQREKQEALEAEARGDGDQSNVLRPGEDPYADLLAKLIRQANAIPLEVGEVAYSPSMIDAMRRFNEQFRKQKEAHEEVQTRDGATSSKRVDRLNQELVLPSLADLQAAESKTLPTLSGLGNTKVAVLAQAGEAALGAEEFFKAERFFIRALDLDANNQLALAGLAHAQLGAGLYRSAAFSLRKLLTKYPEMALFEYAENLKPSPARLMDLVENLQNLQASNPVPDSGLLIAYAATLLDDQMAVSNGLRIMSESTAEDPLREFLIEAWGTNVGMPEAVDPPTEANEDPAK